MASFLQQIRDFLSRKATLSQVDSASNCDDEELELASDQYLEDVIHPAERSVAYGSLIELRTLLQTFSEPARTTVVLVLNGSDYSVHLPTLLRRETYAFRLILAPASGELLSTLSAGDLALQGRAWGWCTVSFMRDQRRALQFARSTTERDEQLLVLRPSW